MQRKQYMKNMDEIFGENGLLHDKMDGFVPRSTQLKMAESVSEAIRFNGRLVVESGTGTGKTYAYLVPVILSGKPTIISTGTRHLQEQIFHRDLPEVVRMLGRDVGIQLLKGRSNYLCRYRQKQQGQQTSLIGKKNTESLEIIDKWAARTQTGDIAEIDTISEKSPIWSLVTSNSDNCLGGKCPEYQHCFVNRARKNAMEADIVVVNHHLYFSDLTLKDDGFGALLPEHKVVVFDEAHSLAEIASVFFGQTISSSQITDLLTDIARTEIEENSAVELQIPSDRVSRSITEMLTHIKKSSKEPDTLDSIRNAEFDRVFQLLLDHLEALKNCLEEAGAAGEGLAQCFERIKGYVGQLWTWSDDNDGSTIAWFETGKSWFRLHLTPLEVGKYFYKHLDSPQKSWIFTSATLAVNDDFSAFLGRIGLSQQETDTFRWESPYDFPNNTRLYLPSELPDPRNVRFPEALASTILDITRVSQGRAFCLFTSFAMMDKVYSMVKDKMRWPLFKQGSLSKQHLINNFLLTANSVLFGTSSFWQGVDIRGESLSCVIIDKLPFDSPSTPVLKSRLRHCGEQGGHPFMDIQLPDAVIALKQGAGRLVRSETDKGVLVICDSRITAKPYGKIFLNSLPPMTIVYSLEDIESFYHAVSPTEN